MTSQNRKLLNNQKVALFVLLVRLVWGVWSHFILNSFVLPETCSVLSIRSPASLVLVAEGFTKISLIVCMTW